jgi:hypothetical protein
VSYLNYIKYLLFSSGREGGTLFFAASEIAAFKHFEAFKKDFEKFSSLLVIFEYDFAIAPIEIFYSLLLIQKNNF